MSANWRGHIGLIKPTYRGKSFAFWYRNLPPGVECAPASLGFFSGEKGSFSDEKSTFHLAEAVAADLRRWGCDIIVISGSPPFILRGPIHEKEWRHNLEDRLGVPVVTGMAPHVSAARVLGIERIAVATYFREELNNGIASYFKEQGIESEFLPGLAATGEEGLYSTSMLGLHNVSHEEVYRHCKAGVAELSGSVDGLYINGGGWDVAPVISLLEQDLGIPVIWALATEMWLAFSLLGIGDPVQGAGRLLAEPRLRRAAEVAAWRSR